MMPTFIEKYIEQGEQRGEAKMLLRQIDRQSMMPWSKRAQNHDAGLLPARRIPATAARARNGLTAWVLGSLLALIA